MKLFFAGLILLFAVMAVWLIADGAQQQPPVVQAAAAPAPQPVRPAAPRPTSPNEVLAACGKPAGDRTARLTDGVTSSRTLRYGAIDLVFLRDAHSDWQFADAFLGGKNSQLSNAAAARRLPCLKSELRSIL